MTRTYQSGKSSRVKDLIDILILARESSLDFKNLRNAVVITFKNRDTHPIPSGIVGIDTSYQNNYSKLSAQVGLGFNTIQEANQALESLFNPIILNNKKEQWNAKDFVWK